MRASGRHPRALPFAVALLACVCAGGTPAAAQPEPGRPRVGVALGGGAARGLAHVGILRWLDEHRVPVDVIGGTSMGGLIAASLATGMSPGEIEAMIAALDWREVLAPDSPFIDKTFRRKEDARAFPSVIEFGLKGGFRVPTGLSPAEQVNLLFDRVALPYHAVRRFDELPIPFACVAVDLLKSEQVILDAGRLEDALRATMAIPGVFTPVLEGDRVLVDGGILNNVPADVVKGMGADVVIAVDVGRDLSREKRSDTLFTVLSDSLDAMMRAAVRQSLESADAVLAPDLKGLTGADFSQFQEFTRRGYEAADAARDVLLRFAVGEAEYQAHLEARRARRRTAVPQPRYLRIEGVTGAQAEVIRRQIARHLHGPLSTDRLERDLITLTGSDRYETLTYRLEEAGGAAGLIVTAQEKSHGPPYLLAALDIHNTESSSVAAAIRGRLTFFDVLTPGSETRLDVSLGESNRVGAEWVLALGTRGLFVAPRASVGRSYNNLFLDGTFVAEYRLVSRDAAADVGYASRGRFEVRGGYVHERIRGTVRIGAPVLPTVGGSQRYWRARIVFDGQTGPVIPDRGLYVRAEGRQFLETARLEDPDVQIGRLEPDDLRSAEAAFSYFNPVGSRGRLFVSAAGGTSFGDSAVTNAFTLGGPLALGALQRHELRGSNYVLGNAGYLHEVARLFEGALGRIYLGGWTEHGAVFEHWPGTRLKTNVSAGLVMETVIGPAFLTGSVGTDGSHRFYVGIGPFLRR